MPDRLRCCAPRKAYLYLSAILQFPAKFGLPQTRLSRCRPPRKNCQVRFRPIAALGLPRGSHRPKERSASRIESSNAVLGLAIFAHSIRKFAKMTGQSTFADMIAKMTGKFNSSHAKNAATKSGHRTAEQIKTRGIFEGQRSDISRYYSNISYPNSHQLDSVPGTICLST